MTLILVLCLILVWYVKSIVASIQRERMLERARYRSKLDNRLNKGWRWKTIPTRAAAYGGQNELDQPDGNAANPTKSVYARFLTGKEQRQRRKKDKVGFDAFQYQFKPQN